jgi:hypothetical protein
VILGSLSGDGESGGCDVENNPIFIDKDVEWRAFSRGKTKVWIPNPNHFLGCSGSIRFKNPFPPNFSGRAEESEGRQDNLHMHVPCFLSLSVRRLNLGKRQERLLCRSQ